MLWFRLKVILSQDPGWCSRCNY